MADEQNPNKNQQISRATKAAVSKARTPAKSRASRTKIRDKASQLEARSTEPEPGPETRRPRPLSQQKARPCAGLSVGWSRGGALAGR